MNERIEKLAEGCFEYFEPNCDGETIEFNYKKFAELIVRECMTLMNNERDYYSKPGSYEPESYYIRCAAKVDAFDDAARLIKHHFGVEE